MVLAMRRRARTEAAPAATHGPPVERHYPDSKALCRTVHDLTGGQAILSFSCGKDALAAWLQLRDMGFTRIVPYFLYLVPGLEFIERGVQYYEEAFQTPIIRLPHPSLPRMLRNFTFQPPEAAARIEQVSWPSLDYTHIEAHVRKLAGLPDGYVAVGTRTADSPVRLANVRRYGSLNPNRKTFLPVFDWRIADVRDAITRAGLKLTVEYRMFGRSFDGVDYRFLAPIKQHFPRDYERILNWFPLAHLELDRRNLAPQGA